MLSFLTDNLEYLLSDLKIIFVKSVILNKASMPFCLTKINGSDKDCHRLSTQINNGANSNKSIVRKDQCFTTWSIYKTVLPFLINWNWKCCSGSNILTIEHKLVLETSSSGAVKTLPDTIIYLKAIKHLNIRLKQKG